MIVNGIERVAAAMKTIGVSKAQDHACARVHVKTVTHGDVRERRTQACDANATAASVQKRNEKAKARFTHESYAHSQGVEDTVLRRQFTGVNRPAAIDRIRSMSSRRETDSGTVDWMASRISSVVGLCFFWIDR